MQISICLFARADQQCFYQILGALGGNFIEKHITKQALSEMKIFVKLVIVKYSHISYTILFSVSLVREFQNYVSKIWALYKDCHNLCLFKMIFDDFFQIF